MYTSQAVHAFIHRLFTLCDVWSNVSHSSLDPGECVSGSGRVCLWIREKCVAPAVLAIFCFHNPVVCSFSFEIYGH